MHDDNSSLHAHKQGWSCQCRKMICNGSQWGRTHRPQISSALSLQASQPWRIDWSHRKIINIDIVTTSVLGALPAIEESIYRVRPLILWVHVGLLRKGHAKFSSECMVYYCTYTWERPQLSFFIVWLCSMNINKVEAGCLRSTKVV